MKLSALIFITLYGAFILTHCGPGTSTGNCTPNVIDSGLQLKVTALGSNANAYSFELCAPASSSSAVYTVYGGTTESSVSPSGISINAAWRNQQITGATSPGNTFQVTFTSSDNYFAIYQDQKQSDGTYALSTTTIMVAPRKIPGR